MTDAISIPLSVAISIGTGLVTVGGLYAVIKSQLAAIEKSIAELKDKVAECARDLRIEREARHEIQVEHERLKARIGVVERDGDERADSINKLDATVVKETREQNKMLTAIQVQIAQVARHTSSTSQEMRAQPIPRQEPLSDRPGLPPMRKKLTTNRGNE
jgi:chromosome segregation ATPase